MLGSPQRQTTLVPGRLLAASSECQALCLQVSSASGGCDAPLMVAGGTVMGTDGAPRSLGSEPPLYTVKLAGGDSKTIGLAGLTW